MKFIVRYVHRILRRSVRSIEQNLMYIHRWLQVQMHRDLGSEEQLADRNSSMDFVNLSQALLGIQPDYDGLIVDPCLPGKFGDFKVDRRFRDAEYHIEIHKPEGVQKGVSWIEVDGEKIAGNQIPLVDGKKEYHVIVQMG